MARPTLVPLLVVLAACAPRAAPPSAPECPATREALVVEQPATHVSKPIVECPLGSTWNGRVCEGVVTCPGATTAEGDGVCRGRVEIVPSTALPRERTWGAFACNGQSIDACRAQCFLGNGSSCNSLGEMYRDARGRARDPGAAMLAFISGCIARDARACANIGRAYARGDGIEKDALAATKWLGIACAAGDAQACL